MLISRAYFDYWPNVLYLFQLIIGNELQIYVNYECDLGREVGFVAVWRCLYDLKEKCTESPFIRTESKERLLKH